MLNLPENDVIEAVIDEISDFAMYSDVEDFVGFFYGPFSAF